MGNDTIYWHILSKFDHCDNSQISAATNVATSRRTSLVSTGSRSTHRESLSTLCGTQLDFLIKENNLKKKSSWVSYLLSPLLYFFWRKAKNAVLEPIPTKLNDKRALQYSLIAEKNLQPKKNRRKKAESNKLCFISQWNWKH